MERTVTDTAELDLRVVKAVHLKAPIERAFSVFVEQMETWWPATHHIGKTPFVAIFVEPRVGGRWYEQNADGAFCDWGTVLAWDPPHRVRFSWHLGPEHGQPDWVFDPDMSKASEVEIRFRAEGPNATFVELEHSKIERHGEGALQLREMFDGPGAWATILEKFAEAAERGSARNGKE